MADWFTYICRKYIGERKDVSKEQPILEEVLEYKKVMDRLLEIYQQVQNLTV